MAENVIETKSVQELLGKNFFIPDYQRGYRWTSQQVLDFLNDLRDFRKGAPKPYQFYCLQPLVVRKMNETEKAEKMLKGNVWYEVIDGQQRLTTIFLILTALKKTTDTYSLKYQREDKISMFLENLNSTDDIDSSDIDLYYLSSAFSNIKKWLGENGDCVDELYNTLLRSEFVQENKSVKKRDKANNVRFIWYESIDENPITVFTRLNIGKISLTNAELIKAMILNRHNFSKKDINEITLRQQEIASEWDNIEYQLQKEEFWLFLNKPGYENPTRIDYIFNLICKNNVLGLDEKIIEQIGDDKDRTFRYFYEYFKRKDGNVDICWKTVKKYFSIFKEWYEDVHLYHYIGFLISQGHDAYSLSKDWDSATTKTSFIDELRRRIKEIVTKTPLSHQFDEEGKDKGKCRPILLFHNIQTVINRNVVQKENDKYKLAVFYKFPFHLYKLEGWDVEHINSNTTNLEEDPTTREEWFTNIYLYFKRHQNVHFLNL